MQYSGNFRSSTAPKISTNTPTGVTGFVGGGILTIPQLRKAFDQIQAIAQKLAAGAITDEGVANFRKEWQRVFHKQLADKDAREYLEHIKSMHLVEDGPKRTMRKAATGTRKRGGQAGGGGPLAGAPLDHVTQPGVYGTYGNFLPYVAQGFGVGVPIDSQTRPALPDPALTVSRDVGGGALLTGGGSGRSSNRKTTRGRKQRKAQMGSRRRNQRGGSNIITSTNPQSVIHDAKTAWEGRQLPESPSAVDPSARLALPL
jgi:hypothetical protein